MPDDVKSCAWLSKFFKQSSQYVLQSPNDLYSYLLLIYVNWQHSNTRQFFCVIFCGRVMISIPIGRQGNSHDGSGEGYVKSAWDILETDPNDVVTRVDRGEQQQHKHRQEIPRRVTLLPLRVLPIFVTAEVPADRAIQLSCQSKEKKKRPIRGCQESRVANYGVSRDRVPSISWKSRTERLASRPAMQSRTSICQQSHNECIDSVSATYHCIGKRAAYIRLPIT